MIKIITVLALTLMVVTGCNDQASITSPEHTTHTQEPNWIVLPHSSGLQVNAIFSTSKLIDGYKGGIIYLNAAYNGGPFGQVSITSSLEFPRYSFWGLVNFSMSHDDSYCVTTFGPSFMFNKKLRFSIKYTGVNLTGINPSNIKFAYLASNGTLQYANYESINVDPNLGILEVVKAEIPHFSRYGFVN